MLFTRVHIVQHIIKFAIKNCLAKKILTLQVRLRFVRKQRYQTYIGIINFKINHY